MAWYSAGTVTATNNNATVTGSGTLFLENVRVGDGITIAGSTSVHEITNVASNTQLTISPVFTGTTGGSKAYSIVPVQGYVKDLADQVRTLILSFNTIGSSPTLNALATVTGAADKFPYFTSASAMTTATVTATARTLLDDTSVAAMRTTLGLKTAATADAVGSAAAGALMEYGYNANGEFTRYANGIIEQWGTIAYPAGAISTQLSVTIAFPTLFFDVGYNMQFSVKTATGSGNQDSCGAFYANGPFTAPSTNQCVLNVYTYRYAHANPLQINWRAQGRWIAKP